MQSGDSAFPARPQRPPKVSVVVPNFNHARYLKRRIDSILSQTFQDFELILMDDRSEDDSRAILSSYASAESRAKIMFNELNSGSTFRQWNKGVRAAAGNYIWLAESDDYADPHLLERLTAVLDDHPNVGVAYCASNIIDAEDAVLRTTRDDFAGAELKGRWDHDFIVNGRDECAKVLCQQNMIPNASAVLFRKTLFEEVGGADESMRVCGDWKLWATMLLRSDLAHVAETMNYYRTHPQNVRTRSNLWAYSLESVDVMTFIGQAVAVDPKMMLYPKRRLADAWISAWLCGSSPQKEAGLHDRLIRFDPHFNWRVAQRAFHRAAVAAGSGKAGYWIGNLLGRKGK